jgi:hypothetical protein
VGLLFYVDESADHLHHFHVGVLADASQIAKAEPVLAAVAEHAWDLGFPRFTPELHGAEIWNASGGWSRLTHDQRFGVMEQTLDVLSGCGIEVIARGINLDRFRKRYGSLDDVHFIAFRNLMERLNERLRERNEHALVIADEHGNKVALKRSLASAKSIGTPGYRSQKLDRVIDTAHFVDSAESRMVQLADVAAYVRRRRAMGPQNHPNAEAALQRMYTVVMEAVPEPKGQFDSIYWAQ